MLFLLFVFSDNANIQLLFPFLAKFYFLKILIAILALYILFRKNLIENITSVHKSSQLKVLIFLVFWIVMSVPFGVYPGGSFMFITQTYWKTLIAFFIVLAYVDNTENFDKMIWVYISACGLLSIITIMESSGTRLAIRTEIYDANDTALQFVVALPFVIWKFMFTKGFRKVLSGLIFIPLLVCIIQTKSRGGFIGLAAVIAITILQARRVQKVGLLNVLIPLIVVGTVLFYFGGTEYLERISTVFDPEQNYNYNTSYGRINIWKRGLEMMANNPLLGVGVACFNAGDGILYAAEGARYQTAHNVFIQTGAELGFPGLIAFCLIIWSSMRKIGQISHDNNGLSEKFWTVTSNSIFGAWVGFVVTAFFLSAAYTKTFYFLFAMSITFIGFHKASKANKPQDIKGAA